VIVIINSGPLMALAKLGLLDLLSRLYGQGLAHRGQPLTTDIGSGKRLKPFRISNCGFRPALARLSQDNMLSL